MKVQRIVALFLLLVVMGVPRPVAAQESILNGFDEYVNQALKDWEVPGIAIAIVKNDKIVLAKGYGVRKIGEATPVDANTMFAIGSASKAFTAATIALLLDEGKLKWDDPASKYLPEFQLFDPYATREMTVRDLLCHRSGLERGDLLWYATDYNRDEIIRRVRYLKPSWSFRSNFGYQNIMYLTAGQVAARVSGKSWDDLVKERLFKPLGMTVSNTSIRDLAAMNNVATPHGKLEKKVVAIPWRNIDNIAPAGSINSNVTEMANWVRLHLNEGKFNGQQLISSVALKEMHTPQTIIRNELPWSLFFPEARFVTYGLGWFLHDHRGRKVVQHGGNIDGMSALVIMMPEEKLGMVLLSNMNGTGLPTALAYKAFDLLIQAPAKDWSADMLKTFKGLEAQGEEAAKKAEQERVKGTNPSLPLDKYVGTYSNEMYGEAKVSQENGKLVVSYGKGLTGDLEHWHFDTFQAVMRDRTFGKVTINFTLNAQGKVESLKFSLPGMGDSPFRREPEKAKAAAAVALSETQLRQYVGKYELKAPPLDMSVELIGGQLKATVPGQPTFTLTPIGADRFQVSIDGKPFEIFFQFEVVEGKTKGATLEQGGMKFQMTPKA